MVVVGTFVIGCAVLLVLVGCAGTRSETSKKAQGNSPQATASEEEARCEGTQTIKVRTRVRSEKWVAFTTYDLRGCPKGGLLSGTENPDKLAGRDGDDEIRGLGGEDFLIGGLGNDVIYGGPGRDRLYDWPLTDGGEIGLGGGSESDWRVMDKAWAKAEGDDVLYGGDGNDVLVSEKGEDVLYGGDGDDFLLDDFGERGRDKFYCGKGEDAYLVPDKNDYVDSSCEQGVSY